jgi:hypothetical protein
MADPLEYSLKIDAFTPDTIPMSRLAEYMADLAVLLGEPASVHFVRLDRGSTVLVHKIDYAAVPAVEARVADARAGDGAPEPIEAAKRINRRLKEDHGTGVLKASGGAEIFQFPGRKAATPLSFNAFNQEGSLDGIVIRLGGTKDPVPVHLQSGATLYSKCFATRHLAKDLAKHLFTRHLRVYGTGRWSRDDEGEWILDRFTITNFDELDETPLTALVAELRGIPGSDWMSSKDVWRDLASLRGDQDQ